MIFINLVPTKMENHHLSLKGFTNLGNRAPDSRKVVQGFPVLIEYAGRIHDYYFPDYEKPVGLKGEALMIEATG